MGDDMVEVAIYIRVSTLDQARDGYSLDAQERVLRRWCQEHNHHVFGVYADRGISGKDMEHRPELQRLLNDARNGCFQVVAFWALSRFTRSVADLYRTMEQFSRYGVSLFSYTEAFDTSTNFGRAMIGIVGVFAQLERELTAERVAAALRERAEQGKRTCGEILGYDLAGKDSFRVNEKEAEYVRFVFRAYLEHGSILYVAEQCQKRGYVGKRGKIPAPASISVILRRPQYCGYNVFKGSLYKGDFTPIISVDIFNAVQTLLEEQGEKSGRRRKKKLYKIPKK